MLEPRRDRFEYAEQLMPPQGMQLKQAIGTTYSLDLEAFLSVPIALSFGQEPVEALRRDKIVLFQAIQRTASKITVFCQKGCIGVPRHLGESIGLHSLLEDRLVQISLPKQASFHPKIWVLWFVDPKSNEQLLRLVVMSRNLTFDRSWDAAVVLEGSVQPLEVPGSKPLAAFIAWLSRQANVDGPPRFGQIYDAIMKTDFQPLDSAVKGLKIQFQPLGIWGYMLNRLPMEKCLRQAVLSPFLSEGMLKSYCGLAGAIPTMLLSRADQLNELNCKDPRILSTVEAYCMSDLACAGELREDFETDGALESASQDLHAKVFVREFARHSELWLGSANLTNKAFNGNVEFMVRLTGGQDLFTIDGLKRDLIDGGGLFELHHPDLPNPDQQEARRIDQLLSDAMREAVRADFQAKVVALPSKASPEATPQDNTAASNRQWFELQVTVNGLGQLAQGIEAWFEPLGLNAPQPIGNGHFRFSPFREETLTQYFLLRLHCSEREKQAVIKIATQDLPATREEAIMKSIIRTREDFLKHLALLLGDIERLPGTEATADGDAGSGLAGVARKPFAQPLYESLLEMVSRQPERLAWIARDVEKLALHEAAVIPPEFHQLWASFAPYVNGKDSNG